MTEPVSSSYDPNAALVAEILSNIEAALSRATNDLHRASDNYWSWRDRKKELDALFVGDFCIYYRFVYDKGVEAARSTDTQLILAKINQVLLAALAAESRKEFGRLARMLMYVLAGTELNSSLPLLRQGALLYFRGEQPWKAGLFRRLAAYEDIGREQFFRVADASL